MNYALVGISLTGIIVLLTTVSVFAQLGYMETGEVYISTPQGDVAVGAAIADALNDGGLELLDSWDFPRATDKTVEIWFLEVNGEYIWMRLDWQRHTAALVDLQPADVEIYTGSHIATQLYVLATGGEFDPGLLYIPWILTGINPDGYKGEIESWV